MKTLNKAANKLIQKTGRPGEIVAAAIIGPIIVIKLAIHGEL